MKTYTLFPGCLISLKFPYLEAVSTKVLRKLAIQLTHLNGVTCCPEPVSMRFLSLKSWYTIAARNICLAEQIGNDLLTLCSGCNATLYRVNKDLKMKENLKRTVNETLAKIGRRFEGKIEVKSIVRVLYEDVDANLISENIRVPLYGVNVAIHYGCHIFDELKEFDNPKHPRSLHELISLLGADVISYRSEKLCCGAFTRPINEDYSIAVAYEKLCDLVNAGAECLVVICPYCFFQYDTAQHIIKRNIGKAFDIPVFYLTQLIGLSFGFSPNVLGLGFHKVKPYKLLTKIGLPIHN